MSEYTVIVDRLTQRTSKPTEPFTFKRLVRGDTVTLDAEEAERLLEAGAVVEKKGDDEALEGRGALSPAVVPGTGGGSGFNGGEQSTPEAEAARVAATAEALGATSKASKDTASEAPKSAKDVQASKPAK